MPTYEYLCKTCSHRFETWQKMTDEPLTICPECGGHIRRVLYPAGIVFKGSGFYKTDHPGSSAPGEAHESKPAAETSGATESKETKPTESNTPTPTTSTSAKEDSGNKAKASAA